MSEAEKEPCEMCKFFELDSRPQAKGVFGYCKEQSPIAETGECGETLGSAIWPYLDKREHCGRWDSK